MDDASHEQVNLGVYPAIYTANSVNQRVKTGRLPKKIAIGEDWLSKHVSKYLAMLLQ